VACDRQLALIRLELPLPTCVGGMSYVAFRKAAGAAVEFRRTLGYWEDISCDEAIIAHDRGLKRLAASLYEFNLPTEHLESKRDCPP
jgi:hypothetical protein